MGTWGVEHWSQGFRGTHMVISGWPCHRTEHPSRTGQVLQLDHGFCIYNNIYIYIMNIIYTRNYVILCFIILHYIISYYIIFQHGGFRFVMGVPTVIRCLGTGFAPWNNPAIFLATSKKQLVTSMSRAWSSWCSCNREFIGTEFRPKRHNNNWLVVDLPLWKIWVGRDDPNYQQSTFAIHFLGFFCDSKTDSTWTWTGPIFSVTGMPLLDYTAWTWNSSDTHRKKYVFWSYSSPFMAKKAVNLPFPVFILRSKYQILGGPSPILSISQFSQTWDHTAPLLNLSPFGRSGFVTEWPSNIKKNKKGMPLPHFETHPCTITFRCLLVTSPIFAGCHPRCCMDISRPIW